MNLDGVDATKMTHLKEIEEIAFEKRQQWQSAATMQIESLQQALNIKCKLLDELQSKFSQLKIDFKYNLKLLHDRDNELQSMETIQKSLQTNESKFLSELSELHIKVDNMKSKLNREEGSKKEMEMHYKKCLVDQQTQLEIFRTSKDKELEELISEFHKTKVKLEQENSHLKFQLEAQKLDLVNEMECLLQSKEKEQIEKQEQSHNQIVFLEMKNKLLSKEIDVCRNKEEERQEVINCRNKKIDELQNELQKAKWEISDVSSMKNTRILELEAKVKHLASSLENVEKEFSDRQTHLDKEIRRREANLTASKQTLLDREKRFQDEIRSLECRVESSKAEVDRALWDKNNLKSELETQIEKYKIEVAELREKLENEAVERSRIHVSQDAELALLRKRENLLKTENNKLKIDIEKYKKDISKSVERERSMARRAEQIKVDFKRKYEDAESDAFAKTEEFSNNLVKSRDFAVAEKERLKRELDNIKEVLSGTDGRLQVALSILQDHDLLAKFEKKISTSRHSEAITNTSMRLELEEQNNQLKSVIKQMADDMLVLQQKREEVKVSDNEPHTETDNKYVESLEREIIEIKQEKRRMKEEIEMLQKINVNTANEIESNQPIEVSINHPKIQTLINKLNNKIGNLEAEKVDMRAQLQKLQAKFDHQRMIAQQHEHEANSLSTKLRQFELESTANRHRNDQEIKRLKNEISSLTLQLSESRREADEYYRGGIQNNMRAMELSEKVSRLTVGMAADTPWLTDHVQAKLVQDLQDEVAHLQKQLACEKQNQILIDPGSIPATDDHRTAMRLQSAMEHIQLLTREKNMLLESSNKMREELMEMKKEDRPPPNNVPTKESKLDEMEKLQYDLTKKQLAFAQRHAAEVESSKSSSEDVVVPQIPQAEVEKEDASSHTGPIMMSSLDDASIKGVWRMLEQDPSSPSIASERELPKITRKKKIPVASRSKKKKSNLKIRNYNIKDT